MFLAADVHFSFCYSNSACPSMCDKSEHAKMMPDTPMVTMGSL